MALKLAKLIINGMKAAFNNFMIIIYKIKVVNDSIGDGNKGKIAGDNVTFIHHALDEGSCYYYN